MRHRKAASGLSPRSSGLSEGDTWEETLARISGSGGGVARSRRAERTSADAADRLAAGSVVKTISASEVCKVLERHDCALQRIRGSHHIYADRQTPRIDAPVHANRDLKVGTLQKSLKDAGLTEDDHKRASAPGRLRARGFSLLPSPKRRTPPGVMELRAASAADRGMMDLLRQGVVVFDDVVLAPSDRHRGASRRGCGASRGRCCILTLRPAE